MYCTMNVQIDEKDPLYAWCENIARLSNNLYNAALFRQRQMISSSRKDESEYSDNEREIRAEIKNALPLMKQGRKITESGFMNYYFLTDYLERTKNPDYRAHMPRHTANGVLKHVCRDIKSFYEAMHAYRKDPSKFRGRPKMPKYKHKQGICSFDVSNQECVIKQDDHRRYYAKLPHTKLRVELGKKVPGRLKEVHVTPANGIFQFSFVFDDEKQKPEYMTEEPKRIIGIDIGVSNLMAVTNNCGLPCLLYKGGTVKSANHFYNKRLAEIVSVQTKGSTDKFVPTKNSKRQTVKRNNRIKDNLQKNAKHLVQWCVEQRIDTIVIGENAGWKNKSDMGKESNQKFVQIAFDRLKRIIGYLAEREGIRVYLQEESYTSKASFMDGDAIPVYGKEKGKAEFSGTRNDRLYRTKKGLQINADLNGAANILRKCIPDAFKENRPDFRSNEVIRHPDLSCR